MINQKTIRKKITKEEQEEMNQRRKNMGLEEQPILDDLYIEVLVG